MREALLVCVKNKVNGSDFLSEHVGSRLEKFTVGLLFVWICSFTLIIIMSDSLEAIPVYTTYKLVDS